MVRSDREGVGLERWEKWDEAEMNYLMRYEQKDWQDWAGDNSVYAVGEAVRDKVTSVIGVVLKPFAKTGLYVMFPQFDVPQLIRAVHVEKLNED